MHHPTPKRRAAESARSAPQIDGTIKTKATKKITKDCRDTKKGGDDISGNDLGEELKEAELALQDRKELLERGTTARTNAARFPPAEAD